MNAGQDYVFRLVEGFFYGEDHKRTIEKNLTEILEKAAVFPDTGLDETLLKAFGHKSMDNLREHYRKSKKELDLPVDTWIKDLVRQFGNLTPIPAAGGLGAFVICMLIDIIVAEHKRREEKEKTAEEVFEHVFAREKLCKVRDVMEEYVKRHQMNIRNLPELKKELERLEKAMSYNLTELKNSMTKHMSSQTLKIWINGACFHIQMIIHLARLGERDSTPARALISTYERDWKTLLSEYKQFKLQSVKYTIEKEVEVVNGPRGRLHFTSFIYKIFDEESQQTFETSDDLELKLDIDPVEIYVNKLMGNPQIDKVHSHFRELEEHLEELITKQDHFDFELTPPLSGTSLGM